MPQQIVLKSPVLLEGELAALLADPVLSTSTLEMRYNAGQPGALASALKALCADAEAAVRGGCECVVLSDRLAPGESIDLGRPPIPTLLAVGAVHHHLIR